MQDVGRCAPPALDGRLQLADVPEGAEGDIDPRWTRRALLSLLDNAAVHGRGSGPVELCAVDTPDGWRFEVTDHGGGIPVGHESSVFEPFYRAGSDRNMPGLGLALVRSVAEAHGGSAGLLNRPGTGVTFWLCVPR
jgi:signal transduction histidine kinase